MKNNILRITTGLALWLSITTFQACDFLDIDPYINDTPTLDSVFQRRETSMQYLYNVYSYTPDGGNPRKSPWIPISDECICTYQDENMAYYNFFCNNNMSAYDPYFQQWKYYYQGIRNASIFLKRISECKELNAIQLREMIGEAYFLRAYFYFELMKEYGPVPIAPRGGYPLDTPMDELLVPRNTWDECVQFVKEELTSAIENLPETRPDIDFGKPTKGAAYAVMSRLLLYNASPLFNGNGSYADFINRKTGVPYFNPEYKDEKWAEAAWAAKQVIATEKYELHTVPANATTPELPASMTGEDKRNFPDGAGGIDPYKSYKELFDGTIQASDNKEVIFGRSETKLKSWVQELAPFQMGDKGSSTFNITQKLVNAYYMADGRSIQNSSPEYPYTNTFSNQPKSFSGYDLPSDTYGWYVNREARFYVTVGFCNSHYYGTSTTQGSLKDFPCQFYFDSPNGKDKVKYNSNRDDQYCMTGYLCRKYLHNEDHFLKSGSVRYKIWMNYRLAEIYLNYAEALNELQGTHTVNNEAFSRNPGDIRKYFNLVRFRAGLPGMTTQEAQDPNIVRQMIRQERQIELAWEGHRYFDVRRWKIADVEENDPVKGVDVNKTYAQREEFYKEVDVKDNNKTYIYKTFTRRQNFWPIPQDEIVRNPNLDQSPGW